jgi:hypothetical protein
MKRILLVGNSELEKVIEAQLEDDYYVDLVTTLADALAAKHDNYDAIVFDVKFSRGNICNTEELGLLPIELENDKTWGQIYPFMKPDDPEYNVRASDHKNSRILATLARFPDYVGGLGFRGGLMIWTPINLDNVKWVFKDTGFYIKTLSDSTPLSFHEILYVQNDDSLSNLRAGIRKAADFHHKGLFIQARYVVLNNKGHLTYFSLN